MAETLQCLSVQLVDLSYMWGLWKCEIKEASNFARSYMKFETNAKQAISAGCHFIQCSALCKIENSKIALHQIQRDRDEKIKMF